MTLRLVPRFRRLLPATLVLVAGLAVFLAAPGRAQTAQAGGIRGAVQAEDGSRLPGVTVLAARQEGGERTTITDASGTFRFVGLLPGTYTVRATLDGFEPAEETVRVSAGTMTPVDLVMGLGAVTEELVVVADRPLIETTTTELSTNLGAEETDLLPSAREATDLVKFTPGGSNQALWGGSTSQANSYKLDGVGVNQPGFGGSFLLPNVDWIEEFQVRGLGAGAEYGNFQGGVINIVTKSGGNDLRGSLRANFEDSEWNASNLDTFEAGFEPDARYEVNASLSGPITEDRLFYFLSAQTSREDTRIVDTEASSSEEIAFLGVEEEREETKLLAKLTWQAGESGLLAGLLGFDDVQTENRGLDSFTEPAAAETQDSPSAFYNLAWSSSLGADTFYELKLSGYDGDDDRLPKNGDRPAVQILGGDRDLFRNAVFTRRQSPTSNALSAQLDRFFQTGDVAHQLKLGGEYEDGSWLERRARNGGFTWRPEEGDGPFDPDDPATWGFISSDWGSGIELDADTVNAAVYAQDYVDVSDRVRLSLGVRYGLWEGDLTPGFGGGSSFTAIDDEAFDPRLGAVVDFAGDGEWIGKVHWGRYHQSLFALLFDRAIGGEVFQDLEFWDWIGPGLPDPDRVYTLDERDQFFELFDVVATGEQVGPVVDYDQPFVDQLVVSIEHAFSSRAKLGLTWVNRRNDDIVALVDRNLASNYTELRNVEVIDFRSGDPVLGPGGSPLVLDRIFVGNDDILRLGWAPGLTDDEVAALTYDEDFVLTNAPDAEREMDQFQLVFEGRGERVDFSASLVYTDLVGDFFSVSGYADPGGTAPTWRPTRGSRTSAPCPASRSGS